MAFYCYQCRYFGNDLIDLLKHYLTIHQDAVAVGDIKSESYDNGVVVVLITMSFKYKAKTEDN